MATINIKRISKNIGRSGYSGAIGYSGISGISGYSGTSGDSGISGYSGTSGASGTSGYSGTRGTTGTSGTSGYSGTRGTTGTSGTSGYSGYSGTSGRSGYSGISGNSGYSGISGNSGYSGNISNNLKLSNLSISLAGVVTTGYKGSFIVPYSGTCVYWTLLSDQIGSVVVDVWKGTYANFPLSAANSITGTDLPTLSSQQKNQNLVLSNWSNTSVNAGDIIAFNVVSANGVQGLVVEIGINRS